MLYLVRDILRDYGTLNRLGFVLCVICHLKVSLILVQGDNIRFELIV